MGKKPFVILDEYVIGATTSKPAYTDCKFDEVLAKFDRFSMAVMVDNVTNVPASLDIYIEHSPETPLCARTLADYWIRNQAWEPARRMLRLYLAHRADPAAAAALARIQGL